MANNSANAKKFFKIDGKPTQRSRALDQLEQWQSIPAHRWIPITSFQVTNHGYLSQRQADWITSQLNKLQITITFNPISAEK